MGQITMWEYVQCDQCVLTTYVQNLKKLCVFTPYAASR